MPRAADSTVLALLWLTNEDILLQGPVEIVGAIEAAGEEGQFRLRLQLRRLRQQ